MYRGYRVFLTWCAPFFLIIQFSTCLAQPEDRTKFELPAESLDKALRDFATQAKCNISYEPALVAGLNAPAVKGEFERRVVLSILLTGTPLEAVSVNQNTFQVLAKKRSTSRESATSGKGNQPSESGVVHIAGAAAEGSSSGSSASGDNAAPSAADSGGPNDSKGLEEITVTGSHIRGVSATSSIIDIGREEIDRSGFTSIADVMLSLPQNFGGGYNAGSTIGNSQANARYSDNASGASSVNLRGLGPGSTLTLIDGRRMASALAAGGADISSIPIDAIDHVEVVTDSASAVYGSDAVAGVVNVILKKDFQGATTSLSYGAASQGGGTERRASQLLGTNWNGGGAMISFEHTQEAFLDATARGFTATTLAPYSLLPQMKANSATLSVNQDLIPSISIFADALYVARDTDTFISSQYFVGPEEFPTTLRKFSVAAGANATFPHDWKGSLTLGAAEDASQYSSVYRTVPSATPGSAERVIGTMRSVEANVDGIVIDLPAGPLRLAVGAGYRREYFSESDGLTNSQLMSVADGDRGIRYEYGELSLPLVPHSLRPGLQYLDLMVSGRNEHYSDFGEKTVPKVGLVYGPTGALKLRATWGQAFRAPNLYDINGIQQLIILDLANPASTNGSSPALIRSGGNTALQPETATAFSIGGDFAPPEFASLKVSVNGFEIRYNNRISQIVNPYTALTDPSNAAFVTLAPSTAMAQSLYNAYPTNQIFNETGASFNPAAVGAIVDYRVVNVASQTVRGTDLTTDYTVGSNGSSAVFFLNGTYLNLEQQNTPRTPEQTLSGTAFYPPRFRLRTGSTWKLNGWAFTGTVNYVARETNNQVTPFQSVGSWTTIDTSIRYTPTLLGLFSGLNFNLAVINLFDRNPPFVLLPATVAQGLNYDSTNTSPLGRFVRFQVSKKW